MLIRAFTVRLTGLRRLQALALLFTAPLGLAATGPAPRAFDIPAGQAESTLKQFAEQAGAQFFFSAGMVAGARTNAVKGDLVPRQALDALLDNSGLVAVQDEKTGALTVKRADDPNAPRAAQDSDRPTSQSKVEDGKLVLDKFEVFGSRSINLDLPRTRDDAQPYVVFNRDQIASAQASNIQDFFRTRLPMATGVGLVTFGGGPGFNQTVNLRGLGTNQTLILVDGRRLPAFSTNGILGGANTPDLSGIPLASIERIEVLPSTASGIYGGGATGGVINIITRKDYSGGELTLNYVNTFDTDTARRRTDLNFSASLRGGATMLTLTASYEDANDLLTQDRDFAVRARQLAFANNPAAFTGTPTPPRGYTTNIRSPNGAALVLKPQYGGTALGSFFTSVPVGYGGIAADNAAALVANAGRYNLDLPDDLRGRRSNIISKTSPMESFGLGLRQKITPWLEGYVDYQRNTSRLDSAMLFAFTVSGTYTLAATAPNNPFTTAVNVAHPFPGMWNRSRSVNIVTRVAGGLVAKLPGEWQAGLDYVWGGAAFRSQVDTPLLRPTYGTALSTGVLDALRDLNVRPLDYQPYLISGLATDDAGGSRSNALTLRASGPTFRLPAGPVVLSGSAEWRDDWNLANVTSSADAATAALRYGYVPKLSDDGKSGYMEARVPLLAAADSQSKQARLELQLAGRYDASSVTTVTQNAFPSLPSKEGPFPDVPMHTRKFSATSYTAGLRYEPLPDLVLRASFGTGFLAPNTAQLVGPGSFGARFLTLSDPKRGGVLSTFGPVAYTLGSNPDLKPEQSRSYSGGVIYTPRFWPGFRLSVDYTKIEKTDEIAGLSDQQRLDYEDSLPAGTIVRAPLTPADRAAGYTGGVITQMNALRVNFARREVEAVDFQADYTRKTPFGEFHGYAVATWNRRFAGQITPADPMLNEVGYGGSPLEWRGNAGVDWTRGRWSAGWNAQYYDLQLIYPFQGRAFSANTVLTQGSDRWPAQVYHDLFASYQFGGQGEGWRRLFSNVKISVGLQNVFNREPPLRAGTGETGGFQNIEDPRLRRYSINVRKRF